MRDGTVGDTSGQTLGCAHRQRSAFRAEPSEFECGVEDLGRGHNSVDQSPPCGFLRGDRLSGQDHLQGNVFRHRGHQPKSATCTGDETTPDLGQAEHGRVRRDDHVRDQSYLGSSSHRRPVHGRDDRDRDRVLHNAGEPPVFGLGRGHRAGSSGAEGLQIGTATESRRSRAGQDDGSDVSICLGGLPRLPEQRVHAGVDAVGSSRSVDGDDEYVTFPPGQDDRFGASCFGHECSPRWCRQ